MTEPNSTAERSDAADGRDSGPHGTRTGHGHGPAGHGQPGAPAQKADRRKATILVVLAAAGVLIGYMTLRKSGGSSASSGDDGSDVGTAGSGGGSYDGSSANDGSLYPDDSDGDDGGDASDGLAEQLSLLSGQVSQLAGYMAPTGKVPKSHSSGTTAPAFRYRAGLHYVRDRANNRLYQVESNGDRVRLSGSQWAEIRGVDPKAAQHVTLYGQAPKAAPKPAPRRPAPKPAPRRRR